MIKNSQQAAYVKPKLLNPNNIQAVLPSAILLNTYLNTIKDIAFIDSDIVNHNTKLIDNGGLNEDRQVSLESVMFIAENSAYLLSMIVFDYKKIRDIIANALEIEFQIEESENKAVKRALLLSQAGLVDAMPSTYHIQLGVTSFSNNVMKQLMHLAGQGLSGCGKLDEKVSAAIKELTDVDKENIGCMLTNYIYLLRAFNYNPVFVNKITELTNEFKSLVVSDFDKSSFV